MRKGSKSLVYLFARTITLIEKIIDEENEVTHSQISKEVLKFLADQEMSKHCEKNGVATENVKILD
jgi:hypothetical protein